MVVKKRVWTVWHLEASYQDRETARGLYCPPISPSVWVHRKQPEEGEEAGWDVPRKSGRHASGEDGDAGAGLSDAVTVAPCRTNTACPKKRSPKKVSVRSRRSSTLAGRE